MTCSLCATPARGSLYFARTGGQDPPLPHARVTPAPAFLRARSGPAPSAPPREGVFIFNAIAEPARQRSVMTSTRSDGATACCSSAAGSNRNRNRSMCPALRPQRVRRLSPPCPPADACRLAPSAPTPARGSLHFARNGGQDPALPHARVTPAPAFLPSAQVVQRPPPPRARAFLFRSPRDQTATHPPNPALPRGARGRRGSSDGELAPGAAGRNPS
jgi:hypothetical protein